jgi:hypothetical protein
MLINFMWLFLSPGIIVVRVCVTKSYGKLPVIRISLTIQHYIISCIQHFICKFNSYVSICFCDFMQNLTFVSLHPWLLDQDVLDIIVGISSYKFCWALVDWYCGCGATTPCAPRPSASRPFVRRHLVPSVISRGALCQAIPETFVSEEQKRARNVQII